MRIGARIHRMKKLFNIREGWQAKDDWLPELCLPTVSGQLETQDTKLETATTLGEAMPSDETRRVLKLFGVAVNRIVVDQMDKL